ncbi:hypothetical protein PybrP1_002555 [[Pythium] brassicae (nom. inval.)]|nr:hypothetical protein PybrP1_002555 [[Pythium] brassicae (nom. inval.)]
MADGDDVRRLLRDVEAAQQQALGECVSEPVLLAGLKDPALFLLDLICQVDALETQREVLEVLRRVLLPCFDFCYDPCVFQDTHAEAASEAARRAGSKRNVVLKALLTTLHELASKSDVRMEIVEGLVAVAKEVLAHSASSADVVMLFNFLRVGRAPVRRLVLGMQVGLMEAEAAPRAVFTMRGPHGGIVAPSSQMLFSKKGYTFSCGLHLATNPSVVALYSFRGNSGQGVSAVLDGDTLVLKTHVQQGSVSQVVVPFADGRRQLETTWTHLCIVHAKKMVFKDKLAVYLNGKSVYTGSLVYPDPLCMVGGHNCIGTTPALPGLQGKVWSPTLFGSALTDAEIERLHWLAHWKHDLSSAAAENTGLADKSKFAFSYDARSCDAANRVCYDISGNDCHGWLEPGTHAFVTQRFVQALDCIGGSACFLLLLLDQIPEMADFHPQHEFAMDEISQVFLFVAAGLKNSVGCRSHFIRLEGVKVLAFVLQSISPSYLSLELLDGVTKILEALVESAPQQAAVEYINLLLFLNTSWYLSPFETQSKLLGDVLPRYLKIVQEKQQHSNSSGGYSSPARTRRIPGSWSDEDARDEVNVRFFCNLLVQVYAPCSGEPSSIGPMDDAQLEVLRKLIIYNLIELLLFPVVPDASVDQWRQLVVYIQQRSLAMNTSEGGCQHAADARDKPELKEIVQYLTRILSPDNHAALTPQAASMRQIMMSKVTKLSEGTLRLWWKPMMSASESTRLEALTLFEAYTLDRIVLRKRDMLMLYSALQAHPLTLRIAELLLDIVIGKKRPGYLATTASALSFASSSVGVPAEGGARVVNIARQDFVPLILLALLQHADADVQALVLFEIKQQMSSPISGESLKEAIRCWPPWLCRLRALSASATERIAASEDEIRFAECNLESSLQDKVNVLRDKTSSASARLEAIQEISIAEDTGGLLALLRVVQTTEQPISVTKAITSAMTKRLPDRCHSLVHKMATQMIVDIVALSVLYVRNGWMHFLEFYFYYYQQPSELCAVSAAICEKVLAKAGQKDFPNVGYVDVLWENLSQVAAILTQCQIVAQHLRSDTAALLLHQQRELMQKAFELWLVVLPHMHQINWVDFRAHLAAHANYGDDVTADEKELFCNLVATRTRSRILALQCGIELIGLSQQTHQCTASLIDEVRKLLGYLQLIPPARSTGRQGEPPAHAAVKNVVRRTRSSSGSSQAILNSPAAKAAASTALCDSSAFIDATEGDSPGKLSEQKEIAQLHVLEACFSLLRQELTVPDSFSTSFAIVEIMVAVASSALVLQSELALPELTKTLQIITSTNLSFFHEVSQIQDFFTLWLLHREIHQTCCDPGWFPSLAATAHAPFLRRWQRHVQQCTTDFNPYLTQKHASSQADILSHETQSCERLWKQTLADDVAATAVGAERDSGDDSRLSLLKEGVEKFASSVHKLISHTSSSQRVESPSGATSDTSSSVGTQSRRVADGYFFKVDSKENSLRMHLRLKKVRESYRLRNISCEFAGSVFKDTESRGSGAFPRQLLRGSRDGIGEQDQGWLSDAGSDYSDFLADAQMRAALIRSCSNVDMRNSEYELPSDEDDADDDEGLQFGDPLGTEDASEEVKDVLAFYASPADDATEEDDIGGARTPTGNDQSPSELMAPGSASSPSSQTASACGVIESAPSSSSSSSLSAFSIGASVLSVVGGVAGMVQKAARDAKDAVEFGVDSLYTAKDALTDEAQSLLDEVSTYMDENNSDGVGGLGSPLSSSPSARSSPIPIGASAPGSPPSTSGGSPALFPASPSPSGSCRKLTANDKVTTEKARNAAKSSASPSKQDLSVRAKLVRHMHIVEGALVLADSALQFLPDRVVDEHDVALVEKKSGEPVDKMWRFLFKRRQWMVDDIVSLNRRRYLLKSTALEIFVLSTRRNYFFNLSQEDLTHFHESLMARRPLMLKRDPAMRRLRHPSSIFRNSTTSARWVNHEISTFEYLMWLNTIAGRTYNDLTQYPIFPWVVADYESPVLDLSRQSTFRDLKKPIGALDPARLKFFQDRYNAFDDPDIPKFMYGTHYSNIGAVLYYLIRLEPYTSYAMSVQGGKFDHADRLFHSVAETWKNCLKDFTDVKELTPEWFYLPDFLVNCNGLELGTRQNGVDLGDVVLPPWARSPEDFVMKNLVALESEYVSANIHHWIDLVFGAKQRGPAAVAANNVFFYLTYEGMVDIDSISDPVTKSSMRAQIAHFGQTPSQVLRDPHPPRSVLGRLPVGSVSESVATVLAKHAVESAHAIPQANLSPLSSSLSLSLSLEAPADFVPALLALPHEHPVAFVHMVHGTSTMLCVDRGGMMSTQRFGGRLARVHHSPFRNDLSTSASKASGVFKTPVGGLSPVVAAGAGAGVGTPPVGSPPHSASSLVEFPVVEYVDLVDRKSRRLASERHLFRAGRSLSNTMAFISGGSVFCTVGHHDFSARFYAASDGALLYRLMQHSAVVTCLATAPKGRLLALGSADSTISVWKVADTSSTLLDSIKLFRGSRSSKPVLANDYAADQVLLGHSAAITCVALSDELGVCVSGSAANECLAHNLYDGAILREFAVPGQLAPGVLSVAVSPVGHVLVQSVGTGAPVLYAFHFNGALMATAPLGDEPMLSLSVCARYSKAVLSNSERAIALSAHTLADAEVLLERTRVGEIASQALSPDETHVVFGVGAGKVVSLPLLP